MSPGSKSEPPARGNAFSRSGNTFEGAGTLSPMPYSAYSWVPGTAQRRQMYGGRPQERGPLPAPFGGPITARKV